jgi:hypothetical protein
MSEIQRYDTVPHLDGTEPMVSPRCDGPYCLYTDLAWYRRQYLMALIINVAVIIACGVLAALLVHEKAARSPVQVPIGAAEKMSLLQEMQTMQRERDDWKERSLHYKAKIKVLNAKDVGYTSQLEALQAKGQELDQLSKEQAQRMSTHQGVVLEAKRVLGVSNLQIVER